MNKTFTAAIAITAVVGLASAAIETAPAGYVDKEGVTTGTLVCNPFESFDTASPTLGDIDGSNLANGDYIAVISAGGQITKYFWQNNVWKDKDGADASSTALARGDAIQFVGTPSNELTSYPLVFSGPLATNAVPEKTANVGYTVVGNAAPVAKPLSAFSITGNYDYNRDYVNLNGTKYIYKNNHWFVRDTGANADNVSVAEGDGLFLYCQKRKRGDALAATITVPSL
jgi:hypothetical protein